MKKLHLGCLILLLLIAFSARPAFGWGAATHAYIVDQLKKSTGAVNLDQIYGAMSPDVFNYLFDFPYFQPYLQDQTHHYFMKVWDAVKYGYEKPDAFGFVSHNDTWGADWTAHHASLTLPQVDPEGYIITKAKALHEFLWANVPEYQGLSLLGIDYDTYIEMCHNVVEAGVDILVQQGDPQIGKTIVDSALRPDKDLRALLVRAYLEDFMAAGGIDAETAMAIILGAEDGFRDYMITYGTVLQQDLDTIKFYVVEDFSTLVVAYLYAKGIELPPGTDLRPLIGFALDMSMYFCAGDAGAEIGATIAYLGPKLKAELK